MKRFTYQVDYTDSLGERETTEVAANAMMDELARREIIHKVLVDGGRVHRISLLNEQFQPQKRPKRRYGH